jgi:hypothetical protein
VVGSPYTCVVFSKKTSFHLFDTEINVMIEEQAGSTGRHGMTQSHKNAKCHQSHKL